MHPDAPLVVHVVHQFGIGGLESVVVNLVNQIPESCYRHAIVSLTDNTELRARLRNPGTRVVTMHKRPGKDLPAYARLWRWFRAARPDVVHTHTMATLDVQIYSAAAGVPCRIHTEHGQFSSGMGARPSLSRRLAGPLIHRYTTVNRDLADYLVNVLGIPASRVRQIYNGVDIEQIQPRRAAERRIGPDGFAGADSIVIGTVGRMESVKNQITLAEAFALAVSREPELGRRLRLALIGAGPLLEPCRAVLKQAGVDHLAWLPGARHDIPAVLQALDVFVLPSISEGASVTLLEAMAAGLPVIATDVGGNPELVEPERTGRLIPPRAAGALAEAIARYAKDPEARKSHGLAGRARIERDFSLRGMAEKYMAVYREGRNS